MNCHGRNDLLLLFIAKHSWLLIDIIIGVMAFGVLLRIIEITRNVINKIKHHG